MASRPPTCRPSPLNPTRRRSRLPPSFTRAFSTFGRSGEPGEELWLGYYTRAALKAGMLVAGFFNCLVFPLLLVFGAPRVGVVTFESGWAALFVCIDVFLWFEMAATFFTPGFSADGEVVRSRRAVASAYLRGKFALDALGRFPWSFVLPTCDGRRSCLGYGHLARLTLLPRAFNIVEHRVEGGARDLHSPQVLGLLAARSLVGLHWFACAVYWVGITLRDDPANPRGWLHTQLTVHGLVGDDASGDGWSHAERYLRAFHRGLLIVTGESVLGERTGAEEVLLNIIGMLLGILWLAYFTSNMVQLVSDMNSMQSASRQKLEQVARFMANAQLPAELRGRASSHLRTVLLHKRLVFNWRDLLTELSAPLQNEVALHMLGPLLMSPKIAGYFQDEHGEVDPAFIKMLVMRFGFAIFAPGDYIIEEGEPGNEVFFLAKGVVRVSVRGSKIAELTDGACFGEIALVVPDALRTASVVARTFCEAHALQRAHFEECLQSFPELRTRIGVMAETRLRELQEKWQEAECRRKDVRSRLKAAFVTSAARAGESQSMRHRRSADTVRRLSAAWRGGSFSMRKVKQPKSPENALAEEHVLSAFQVAAASAAKLAASPSAKAHRLPSIGSKPGGTLSVPGVRKWNRQRFGRTRTPSFETHEGLEKESTLNKTAKRYASMLQDLKRDNSDSSFFDAATNRATRSADAGHGIGAAGAAGATSAHARNETAHSPRVTYRSVLAEAGANPVVSPVLEGEGGANVDAPAPASPGGLDGQ